MGDACVLGAFLACFWLLLWVGSDHALGLLFRNPDYHGQDDTIRLLGLALLATAVSIPASNGLTCLERPQAIFWATLGSATTNAALSFLLIPSWGVAGAACGFLAGSVVGAIGRWAALAWRPELRPAPSDAQARAVLRLFEAGPAQHDAVDVGCVAQPIARAMAELWSAGQTYSDLNVDNVLCDPASQTLCFPDPGNPSQMLCKAWTSPSQDLAYFVFEASTSLRRALSHPRAEAQLRLVTADVVRAVLSDIPLLSERRRLLAQMRDTTQVLLGTLDASWTPRGAWRALVRQVGLRRIASLTDALQTEIELVAAND